MSKKIMLFGITVILAAIALSINNIIAFGRWNYRYFDCNYIFIRSWQRYKKLSREQQSNYQILPLPTRYRYSTPHNHKHIYFLASALLPESPPHTPPPPDPQYPPSAPTPSSPPLSPSPGYASPRQRIHINPNLIFLFFRNFPLFLRLIKYQLQPPVQVHNHHSLNTGSPLILLTYISQIPEVGVA